MEYLLQVSSLLQQRLSPKAMIPWPSLAPFFRHAITLKLNKIQKDQLILRYPDGQVQSFGSALVPSVEMSIMADDFWIRVALLGDIGFAQAFMLGHVMTPDLVALLQLFIHNQPYISNGATHASGIVAAFRALIAPLNSPRTSALNVAAHYDVCNEMFESFLSPDMTYSCPIWSEDPLDFKETLETAQLRKIHHVVRAARIQSSDHVLEIGTGWGRLAIEAVRTTNCSVTSVTLSKDQKTTAEQRIADAGFSDRIEVLLCDYRTLSTPEVLYDKVVSIEMVEHVGRQYLETYFGTVDRLLKPEGGIAVFQSTTMPESIYQKGATTKGFIPKYIFPGGHIPSATYLIESIDKGTSGHLCVHEAQSFGSHYPRALRTWKENFLEAFESKIRPVLLKKYPGMDKKDVAVFKRKWEYYFSYCEAGFLAKVLNNFIITAHRQFGVEGDDSLPHEGTW